MTDMEKALEAARRIADAEDNRDSFPDGRPQWSKDLELLARALLATRASTVEERQRCVDIVQAARFDEIDRDFRAIISMIEGGQSVADLKK